MNEFVLYCTNDRIWNTAELLQFLNQNQHKKIRMRITPEAICLHNLGLYDILDAFNFESVTIRTRNPFEQHPKYQITFNHNNMFLEELPVIPPSLHKWDSSKIFYTCYGRPTAARLGLASYLHSHYAPQSHLHFSAKADVEGRSAFELDKLFGWDVDSAARAAEMAHHMPLIVSDSHAYDPCKYDYVDPLTQHYQHCLVDVVVESHVAGRTFFVTEKTTRPMWLKKPFIAFSNQNYLLYLRQMGFRTFGDFWDEDYDGYQGRDRYLRILKLIDDLAQLSTAQLEKLYADMQYTLDHNYQLLATQTYTRNIQEVD